jgi:hypothetical protein
LPEQIIVETFVIAAFDGAHPRFLAQEPKNQRWVVRTDAERAERFHAASAAQIGLALYGRQTQGGRFHPPAEWVIWKMTARFSFAQPPAASR